MKASFRSEMGILEERVHAKDEQLRMSWGDVDALKGELAKAQHIIRQEAQLRISAEQHVARAQMLEKTLLTKEQQLQVATQESANHRAQLIEQSTRIQEMQRLIDEKAAFLNQAKDAIGESFKAISAEVLHSSAEQFFQAARAEMERLKSDSTMDVQSRQKAVEDLIRPLKDSLDKVDQQYREIEEKRTSAYSSLTHQLSTMALSQERLNSETASIGKALRTTVGLGRWGEIQLKRVVELAGMVEYCDFQEQPVVPLDDGVTRPDMLVRLPGHRQVAVDTKAPFVSFLEAVETKDDAFRLTKLQDHASQIRSHIAKLGSKAYWDQFLHAPEFVVLFLPGDTYYSAALEQDPSLVEYGIAQNVIVATPTTLISLLRAVSYGWKQEKVAENAQKISELGKALYGRVQSLAEHLGRIGTGLEQTVRAYNGTIGSFENKVLVAARRFKELGAADGEDIAHLKKVERSVAFGAQDSESMRLVPGPGPDESLDDYDPNRATG
jgi:DNA recombination protein RmuC